MRCLALLGIFVLVLGCSRGLRSPDFQPNLVLIIADDLGYADLGFTGSPIVSSPHLDRLAQAGTLFTQAQTSASSSRPSLRALLTGVHPYQWSARLELLREGGSVPAPDEEVREFDTLPRLLSTAGYVSFQAGPFWEASHAIAGFDGGMQPAGDSAGSAGPGARSVALGRAVAFLQERTREPDVPFLLWFVAKRSHRLRDTAVAHRAKYADADLSRSARAYYAGVSELDAVAGTLLDALERLDLSERTLIVFLSDNGWLQDPRADHSAGWGASGGKGTLREPGYRTPLVFRLPGYIEAGARRDELVSTLDVFATLLDYAKRPPPPNRLGRSLRPLLEGEGGAPHEFVVGWSKRARSADPGLDQVEGFSLRSPEWRYLWFPKPGRGLLFAIGPDGNADGRDVAQEQPELALRLRRQLHRWRRETRELATAP